MRYREGLRGLRQYWMARQYELSDMIKQLGHQGLIFFTFSAADFHWPELHRLMPEVPDSTNQYIKNVVDNPHIATWLFRKCFEMFFHDVLIPRWKLEDWWFRFEWQYRGSVHVYAIAKKRNV